jgi:NAD(P)-dependent dehydrogenase (short-subunit alcohol dehydrogenase family)
MARLNGKVAIVTGAGAGNGRAIARAFAEAGASVVIGDVDETAAQETAALIGERAVALRADVSKAAGLPAAGGHRGRAFQRVAHPRE